MNLGHLLTPGKAFLFSGFLLTAVQAFASLNHITTGRLFLWLAFGSFIVSLVLLVREFSANRQTKKASEQVDAALTTRSEPVSPSISRDDWRSYTRGVFFNAIWTWHYKPEFGKAPMGLEPYCSECRKLERLGEPDYFDEQGGMLCFMCGTRYYIPHDSEKFKTIRNMILQKHQDGSWRDTLERQ